MMSWCCLCNAWRRSWRPLPRKIPKWWVSQALKPQLPFSAYPVTWLIALCQLCFLNTMLFMKAQIFPYVSKEPLRGEKRQKMLAGSGLYRASKFAEQWECFQECAHPLQKVWNREAVSIELLSQTPPSKNATNVPFTELCSGTCIFSELSRSWGDRCHLLYYVWTSHMPMHSFTDVHCSWEDLQTLPMILTDSST